MKLETMAIIISICSVAVAFLSLGISGWTAYRTWRRDYREQAEQVTAWRIYVEKSFYESEDEQFDELKISNQSKLMIYDLIAQVVAVGGTDHMKTPLDEPDLEQRHAFGAFVGNVPPGEKTSRIRNRGVSHGSRYAIEIAFRDASGRNWVRRGNGTLEEIKKSPVDFYEYGTVNWQDR
jgi:hypothetical protein